MKTWMMVAVLGLVGCGGSEFGGEEELGDGGAIGTPLEGSGGEPPVAAPGAGGAGSSGSGAGGGQAEAGGSPGAGGAAAGGESPRGDSGGLPAPAPSLVVQPDGSRWDCTTLFTVTASGARAESCRCEALEPGEEAVGCPADAPPGTCVPGPCQYRGGCCVAFGGGCSCMDGAALGTGGCDSVNPEARRDSCP